MAVNGKEYLEGMILLLAFLVLGLWEEFRRRTR
jgi:hypothetical protein